MFRTALILTALAAAASANAAPETLFEDSFDTESVANDATSLTNWTVYGQVDVLDGQNGLVCTGRCIGLDGTQGYGTVDMKPVAFKAGRRVTVSFELAGNQRDGLSDGFVLNVAELGTQSVWDDFKVESGFVEIENVTSFLRGQGSLFWMSPVSGDAPFSLYSFSFLATLDTKLQMNFGTASGRTLGPVIDNVRITQTGAVPEPATWAMLITGFGLVGAAARRRLLPA